MIKRVRFVFSGVVQGVGFRPFVHRVVTKHNLNGFVQNRPDGVIAELEGAEEVLEHCYGELLGSLPLNARVVQCRRQDIEITGETSFQILPSASGGEKAINIPPDIAVCEECLQEIFDPADRRFEYPFTNCTNCGPRFTILRNVPYDRGNTAMACMPLCAECRAEYENTADRRFHAEPNACPVCGPKLWLADADGKLLQTANPISVAAALLKSGKILAIKGLGGFHLAVDASNADAVQRLRMRKFREEKPLALMVRDIASAGQLAAIDDNEARLLSSPAAPIVLLKKKSGAPIAAAVAPGVPNQGIMLPNTPLHHLLLREFLALVMTSANQVDEPLCIGNREAIKRLSGIVDFFLFHNRDILVRCDDSLMMVAAGRGRMLRRARGFVPDVISLRKSYLPVLALGPQMKTTICVLKGEMAFISPHIGDMETPEARDFYRFSLLTALKIAECTPGIVACDMHPGYHTSLLAQRMKDIKLIQVQHHHAHIVSCMAENRLDGGVLGIAMDGSGYGTDDTVWGGEFLETDELAFQRRGFLQRFFLPGGKMAIQEPWRIGASLLECAYGEAWRDVASCLELFPDGNDCGWMENIMCNERVSPRTSSLGRLFDGVAAIMGLHKKVSFEGQAAMALEDLATAALAAGEVLPAGADGSYSFVVKKEGGAFVLNLFPAVCEIVQELKAEKTKEKIALRFHNTLAFALTTMAVKIRQETGLARVVLSGGCFQNKVLLDGCDRELRRSDFNVFAHSRIPTNDGGISLGQALIAAAQCERDAFCPPTNFSSTIKDYGL